MVEISDDQGMEVVDLRFESLRALQEDLGPYLSTEGFFLEENSDFVASEVLRFRLMLPGDFVLIEGTGVVVWVRSPEEATPKLPYGVAVGFATLSDSGRELVERIVNSHVESGGKPFDLSRSADNGRSEVSQSDEKPAPRDSGEQGELKFSVREEPAPDPGDEEPVSDPEQRLPFEAAVEPEHDEIENGGGVDLFSEAVRSDGDDRDNNEAPGVETHEYPELQEETDSSDAQEKRGGSGLLRILIGIIVVVAGAWAVSTQFPEYMPWTGPTSDVVIGEPVDAPGEDLAAELITPLTDDDLEAAVEAAVDAATVPEPAEELEPQPTEVPVTVDVVSTPGSEVVDIKATAGENGTVLLIRTDGFIDNGRVRTSILLNPARILVRIAGIDSLYRPLEISVGTSEVRGIRVGHHPETRPPSLWVVLDRTDEDIVVRDVQISGNSIQVEVGR